MQDLTLDQISRNMKFSRSFFPTIQTPFPSKFPSATSKNLTLSLLFRLSYFLLHFDTSPPVLSALSSRLRADPRVVKWTTLKLGSTLSSLVPPGLSGGDANANFNNPSSVRKMSKVFGDDLMRDLEGSKMAETLKKDLENEILASENGKFKALDEEERKNW